MPESVTLALGAAGPAPTVAWGGRVWTVGHPTQAAKAALEQACAGAALEAVLALKGAVSAEAFDDARRAVLGQIAARHFATFAAGWQEVMRGPRAGVLQLFALVKPCHAEFTVDMAERMAAEKPDECEAAVVQVYPSFLKLLASGAGLPAAEADALAAQAAGLLKAATPAPPSTTCCVA